MPYKISAFPHKDFFPAMSAEILRIRKAITRFQHLIILIGRIMQHRGPINHIKKAILKPFNSHQECFIILRKTNCYYSNKLL